MRARWWFGALLLPALCGCTTKTKLTPNPLAQADPGSGFVSESFTQSGEMLQQALLDGIADPDRVAFGSDAAGVARLAGALDVAEGCAQQPCNVPSQITNALASAAQNTDAVASVGRAHADALERWASIAAAH